MGYRRRRTATQSGLMPNPPPPLRNDGLAHGQSSGQTAPLVPLPAHPRACPTTTGQAAPFGLWTIARAPPPLGNRWTAAGRCAGAGGGYGPRAARFVTSIPRTVTGNRGPQCPPPPLPGTPRAGNRLKRGGGGLPPRKRHTTPHSAQSQHANYWAPRTRKRHQQEHRPQRPTERSDPTQHAKGRTGDRPGPRKGTATRRNVTQGAPPSPTALTLPQRHSHTPTPAPTAFPTAGNRLPQPPAHPP